MEYHSVVVMSALGGLLHAHTGWLERRVTVGDLAWFGEVSGSCWAYSKFCLLVYTWLKDIVFGLATTTRISFYSFKHTERRKTTWIFGC